jgi:hypothetical protein
MEINATKIVKVNAKTLKVHCKVRDCGSYTLLDETGAVLRDAEECYVPGFMPGQHYGDYLELIIDIDTGQITNWKVPTVQQIEEFIEGDE